MAEYRSEPIKTIKNRSGSWDSYVVGVFDGDKKIGEYKRNYSFMETFHPFRQGDQWYALYSPDYTGTRIMSLPDCKDIGGESRDGAGFCPVEYYVPEYNLCTFRYRGEDEEFKCFYRSGCEDCQPKEERCFLNYGFVAGCHWGDDSSWKIQFLNLDQAKEGIIKRDDRFGYIELPAGISLKQAINMRLAEDIDGRFEIASSRCFDLKENGWIE